MLSANSENFTLFSCLDSLYFSSLIAVAKTSKTKLNSSGESGHLCLVPDFRGNAFNFSPLNNVCCGFIIYGFYYVEICSFYACFLESFFFLNHKWVLNFVKGFLSIY